ncbi:hypothetical protein BC833DRAFT_607622 [Globomyces pollinis-pini]|nr:hypothetical protein BC833DRAFT_607622 [Globomyces pollinis-pini]
MHGLWYTRTYLDLLRELLIGKLIFYTTFIAWKIRIKSLVFICVMIQLQHLSSLFINPDGFIPDYLIPPTSLFILIIGIQNQSLLFTFIGVYMTQCHFKELDLTPLLKQNGIHDDWLELFKLFFSIFVWNLIMFDLLWNSIRLNWLKCYGWFLNQYRRGFKNSNWMIVDDGIVECNHYDLLREDSIDTVV